MGVVVWVGIKIHWKCTALISVIVTMPRCYLLELGASIRKVSHFDLAIWYLRENE